MVHQVTFSQPQGYTSGPVTPAFTPEQFQQLLALIGTPNSPLDQSVQGKDTFPNAMANVVSSTIPTMGGMDFTHSVF